MITIAKVVRIESVSEAQLIWLRDNQVVKLLSAHRFFYFVLKSNKCAVTYYILNASNEP